MGKMGETSKNVNWKKYWAEKLDKNCNKCWWSTYDTNTLKIYCALGKEIKDEWTTAHNCTEYEDVQKSKKENYKQLDLFINHN